jgi:hypothetical protein
MKTKKKYLIALEETRSMVALAAGILIFACALSSIFVMAENSDGTFEYPLHYFTVWSNILSAVASAFMIPYAVERHQEKKVYPAPLDRAASVRRRKLPCHYTDFGLGDYTAHAGS